MLKLCLKHVQRRTPIIMILIGLVVLLDGFLNANTLERDDNTLNGLILLGTALFMIIASAYND